MSEEERPRISEEINNEDGPSSSSATYQQEEVVSKLEERQKLEDAMDPKELEKLLESANATKLEANQCFGQGTFEKALELYNKALEIAPLKFKKERAIILGNCSAANIKVNSYNKPYLLVFSFQTGISRLRQQASLLNLECQTRRAWNVEPSPIHRQTVIWRRPSKTIRSFINSILIDINMLKRSFNWNAVSPSETNV